LAFSNEIGFLTKLQHTNIVKLLGYCIHGTERVLVYEYMANGSFDTFIFGMCSPITTGYFTSDFDQIFYDYLLIPLGLTSCNLAGARTRNTYLDWPTRSQVMKGVAEGLLYLHKQCGLYVIHGDLKPSNILLDSDMNPKISDFGIARVYSPGIDEEFTDRTVGST
jgi:interleukin-1 receptor-associated kinase 1